MKNSLDMDKTNRMAIKLEGNVKIVIDKKIIDGEDRYIITFGEGIAINGIEVPKEGIVSILTKLTFSDNDILLDGVIVTNARLKTVWVNQDGFLHEFVGFDPYEIEEDINVGDLRIILEAKEISADLDMVEEMRNRGIIEATDEELDHFWLRRLKPTLVKYDKVVEHKPNKKKMKIIVRRKKDN